MEKNVIEFDLLAHNYDEVHAENIRLSGFPTTYFDEYKIKEIGRFFERNGMKDREMNFLNFGCGIGKSERFIRQYLPNTNIYSVDVSTESLAYAKEKNKDISRLRFERFDGQSLPFKEKFDVIFIANVFHHVPRENHAALVQMLKEALGPGGHLFMFEHNPLNPVTVRTIKACPFDKNAVLLTPMYASRILKEGGLIWRNVHFTIFFPSFLSFLLPMEKYLSKFPLGAQYYFIAKKDA